MYQDNLNGKQVSQTWVSDGLVEITFTDGTKLEITLRCCGEGHLVTDIS